MTDQTIDPQDPEGEESLPSFDIRLEGRAWGKEALARFDLTPEKIEMIGGRLFWSEEERLRMLGLLLENVGLIAAVRLAPAARWRAALARVEAEVDAEGRSSL